MSASGSRILWIEDKPESIAGTRMSLEMEGHEVVTADDVAAAIELPRLHHFDLMLVDEMLPPEGNEPGSGSRIVERLQAGDLGVTNAGIPFAFVTANIGLVDFASVGLTPGFQGAFSKIGNLTEDLTRALVGLITVPGLVNSSGRPLDYDSPASRDVIVAFKAAQAEILEAVADEPDLLHALHDREFEELVAELFARNGCEVELTARSGDRGVDLYAIRRSGLLEQRYVIECKRNSPDNRVGPSLVRQLRGVVDREQATCGVLVTTSTFTVGANEEQKTNPHRLSLRDFEHLASWLRGKPIFD